MEDDHMWETKTVIIEKTKPNQGFGIAISGGRDNPHFKTGSTAIIVSDIVAGSPSDGLLKVNDEIVFVNNANMSRASHGDAVQALREAGSRARMVVRRMQVPPSAIPAIAQTQDVPPQGSSTPKESRNSYDPQRQQREPTHEPQRESARQQAPHVNGTTEKSPDEVQDNKIRVTLDRGTRGYGFAMGQLFYIRELAPKGPALLNGEVHPGDRVIEINSKSLDKVKTLSEAIDLVLNSPNQISLLLERDSVKPLPAARTPKLAKKPVVVPEPEPVIAAQAAIEVHSEPPPNEMEKSWKSPSTQAAVPEKHPERTDGPNRTKDSWDAASPPEAQPAPVEAVAQSNIIDAYASKWERKRLDQIKGRRLSIGHEGHYINFKKTGSLGIQVAGGNSVGIFTAAVKPKSAAAKQGLKEGDLILEANEIDFREITREEAVLILLALGEEVSLFVIPKKGEFDKIKTQLGDNFFVRANFDYFDKSQSNELTFRKGEIFNVRDTMYQGLIGAWQAKRVGRNGRLLDQGILPNKSRAEQLAIAQSKEESMAPKALSDKKLQRRGSLGGSLRRAKKMFTSQDKLDEQSFVEINFQIPAYERVVLRIADFMRPVVIMGPIADLARMMLIDEMPDRFGNPSHSDTFGVKSSTLPRSGGYDKSYGDSVRLSSIRGVIHENRHCLLDLTPEGVEKMMFFQLSPIVILLKTASKTAVKAMRQSLVQQLQNSPTGAIDIDGDPLSTRHVRKVFSMTKKLEEFYPHIYTAKLNTHLAKTEATSREWYHKLKEIIFRQQSEMAWMPEEKPDDTMMEDVDLRRPNYLSYVSGGESDTEGESVCSEAKRFEDFEDSHTDTSPPRSPAAMPPYRPRGDEEDVFATEPHHPDQGQRYREPEREEYPPRQAEPPIQAVEYQLEQSAPPQEGYGGEGHLYDTPYEDRIEERTETTVIEAEYRRTAERSVPLAVEPEETGFMQGQGPDRQEEDVPVLQDPHYDLPPGFKAKEGEKKPFNAIKVYPSVDSAVNARQSLRRTEVVKTDNLEERRYESEIKRTSGSLKKVTGMENHVLKDMDERTDVKVSELWQLEQEIQSGQPSRPPAPRNYVVDVSRDGRNRGQMAAHTSHKPSPTYAEVKRINMPQQNGRVEERVAVAHVESRVESAPNGYPDEYDARPPPPRDWRPSSDRPGQREDRVPSSQYRPPPPRDERPAVPSYREPPRERVPPPYDARASRKRNEVEEPRTNREEPYRDYSTGPVTTNKDRPTRNYGDSPNRPSPPSKLDTQYDEPKVIATARGIFDHRGGLLESTETGVSIYIPTGALPEGKKQEIYFKVCQDNKYMPPLDSEGGETLLSPLVMCGPHGLKFKKPIELRLPHKGNSSEGMSFSLKSSDSPVDDLGSPHTGDASKWKNVQLGGRDLDASRAYQVTDDTVSVLVDHF